MKYVSDVIRMECMK